MSSHPMQDKVSTNTSGSEPATSTLANTLFAASIHEIKNRFGLLLNQLESVLAASQMDTSQQNAVAHIRHDAQFIGSELVRVLTVFKSTSGAMAMNVDQQILEDFLEEVVARHATTAHATACAISFDCDPDLTGFFDVGIVTVVLDTCIYNAIKAGAKTIVLRSEEGEGDLSVHVDDNGPGFPAEMLNSPIATGKLKVEENSTGLGLFFANTLLAHHCEGDARGSLKLSKSPEGGARVTLLIPQ